MAKRSPSPISTFFVPYQVRKAASSTWVFSFICERCQLKARIAGPLDIPKSDYEKILSAFLKVGLYETNVDSSESSTDLEAMGKLSGELDGWLESLGGVLGEQESMWIRSSFTLPCLERLQLNLDEFDRLQYKENAY